jgi:hypothetical protein
MDVNFCMANLLKESPQDAKYAKKKMKKQYKKKHVNSKHDQLSLALHPSGTPCSLRLCSKKN